jgi:mRNA-degrading endonuclease toxin of MazEF toxin-antitoxin module
MTVVVVPGTTKLSAANLSFGVLVPVSASNGLHAETVFLPFQIRAIDVSRIVKEIGTIEVEHLTRMDAALRDLLGLASTQRRG